MSIYNWSPKDGTKADRYPPHLDLIPSTDEVPIYKIFNTMRLLVSHVFYVDFLKLSGIKHAVLSLFLKGLPTIISTTW